MNQGHLISSTHEVKQLLDFFFLWFTTIQLHRFNQGDYNWATTIGRIRSSHASQAALLSLQGLISSTRLFLLLPLLKPWFFHWRTFALDMRFMPIILEKHISLSYRRVKAVRTQTCFRLARKKNQKKPPASSSLPQSKVFYNELFQFGLWSTHELENKQVCIVLAGHSSVLLFWVVASRHFFFCTVQWENLSPRFFFSPLDTEIKKWNK